MARTRTLTVKQEDIKRLEGLIQKLSDYQPEDRPKAEAARYIAQQLGVRVRIVQDWVRLARPATHRNDTAAAFFSAYERIADLLSEHLDGRIWTMTVPGQRDAFKAITWLLPRVNPERYDASIRHEDADEEDVFSTSGVPQEVFDALTDEQRDEIAELRSTMYAAMERYETIIKEAQSLLLAQDLAQRQASDR